MVPLGSKPKMGFIARADWFGMSIDQYSGGLWNLAPGVRYQIIKNLGLGLDYRVLLLNAKVDGDNWKGKFDMGFSGPTLTFTVIFNIWKMNPLEHLKYPIGRPIFLKLLQIVIFKNGLVF